jgi:hypothetical protein
VILENYINDDICQKDEKFYMRELSKFIDNKTNNRVPMEKFVSFNDFYEQNKDKIKKNSFDYELNNDNKKNVIINDEKELKTFVHDLLNSLLGEEEIKQEQMAKLFLIMKNNKIIWSKIYECFHF